jgi:hypothetical protein
MWAQILEKASHGCLILATAIMPGENKNYGNAASTLVLMHWKSLR